MPPLSRLRSVSFVIFVWAAFCVIERVEIRAAESTEASFIGDWAMKLNDGSAGWLSIQKVNGAWAAELWRVGQTKRISKIGFADGKLTFERHCRVGRPEYEGGPPPATVCRADSRRLSAAM